MSKEKYIDKIRLGAGRSLMVGNVPDQVQQVVGTCSTGKCDLGIESFGLFESASPNFQTYYPEVKNVEDIKPTDDQYINPIFRMLSEVIVRKSYNPVDFSMNGVLKASMPKLLGQTIFQNHEAIVGNELGSVPKVFWQNSYTTKSGLKVPAGINGVFKIDAKSHPTIARNILMEPPAIHSNSVTVEFEWEKSHPSMDLNEFRGKVGTFASDGQLIRRIASNIRNYHETSLVAHGADPYAQKVDEQGNISNADYADSVYSLAALDKERPKLYYFNYREDLLSLNSNTDDNQSQENNKNQIAMKLKLTTAHAALLAFLAITLSAGETEKEVELSADQLKQLNDKLAESETSTTQLATEKVEVTRLKAEAITKDAEIATLKTKETELTGKVTTLESASTVGLTKLREETKRVYTALKTDKADASILASFEKADADLLTANLKQYTEELETKFPSSCGDCGSKNVSKASAKLGDEGAAGAKPDNKITLKSDSDVEREFLEGSTPKFALDK